MPRAEAWRKERRVSFIELLGLTRVSGCFVGSECWLILSEAVRLGEIFLFTATRRKKNGTLQSRIPPSVRNGSPLNYTFIS
jgi:hypothetical protein